MLSTISDVNRSIAGLLGVDGLRPWIHAHPPTARLMLSLRHKMDSPARYEYFKQHKEDHLLIRAILGTKCSAFYTLAFRANDSSMVSFLEVVGYPIASHTYAMSRTFGNQEIINQMSKYEMVCFQLKAVMKYIVPVELQLKAEIRNIIIEMGCDISEFTHNEGSREHLETILANMKILQVRGSIQWYNLWCSKPDREAIDYQEYLRTFIKCIIARGPMSTLARYSRKWPGLCPSTLLDQLRANHV